MTKFSLLTECATMQCSTLLARIADWITTIACQQQVNNLHSLIHIDRITTIICQATTSTFWLTVNQIITTACQQQHPLSDTQCVSLICYTFISFLGVRPVDSTYTSSGANIGVVQFNITSHKIFIKAGIFKGSSHLFAGICSVHYVTFADGWCCGFVNIQDRWQLLLVELGDLY